MNELLVKSKVTTGVENERTAYPSPEAWQAFHHQFRDCFARREIWAKLLVYWRERCGKGRRWSFWRRVSRRRVNNPTAQ
ncbi:MAG: hypothetical protein NTZ24_07950 [Deltaproteobacteria bacterium]|nr:hypothetical protein [Deltaproteobacteria bacterium]